jgi:hypothetical protein
VKPEILKAPAASQRAPEVRQLQHAARASYTGGRKPWYSPKITVNRAAYS